MQSVNPKCPRNSSDNFGKSYKSNKNFGTFLRNYLGFFGLFYFSLSPESHPDLWGNHSLHHPFLTWDNALIMKIITLLLIYNSRITTQHLEQNMTLYECLRRYTRICNESRVTCMKIMRVALPQIQCQLHDHAKSNMTMMVRVIITEWWKVAWQYISEWLWKCHNR